MTSSDLTIRPARETDAWVLDRLAQLDSQRPLTGSVLLAESDGRPVAAVSLTDGRATADPFVESAATVILLRTRAAQLQRSRVDDREHTRLVSTHAATPGGHPRAA